MSSTVDATLTSSARPNSTEFLEFEEVEVETLSIIVWCLGGILLITLLSLLGRIILARTPNHLEYIEHSARRSNVFRIQLDLPTQPSRARTQRFGTFSRDTMGLVPGSDLPITDSPSIYQPQTGCQSDQCVSSSVCVQNYHETTSVSAQHNQDFNDMHGLRAVYEPEVQPAPPQIVTSDAQGRVATVNGFVIRPPSYQDVTSPSSRIPSVIVARPPPRFSL